VKGISGQLSSEKHRGDQQFLGQNLQMKEVLNNEFRNGYAGA
jgi:hypothetical protein